MLRYNHPSIHIIKEIDTCTHIQTCHAHDIYKCRPTQMNCIRKSDGKRVSAIGNMIFQNS